MDVKQIIKDEISLALNQYNLAQFKKPTSDEIAKRVLDEIVFKNNVRYYLSAGTKIYVPTLAVIFLSAYYLTKFGDAKNNSLWEHSNAVKNSLRKYAIWGEALSITGFIASGLGGVALFTAVCLLYDIHF